MLKIAYAQLNYTIADFDGNAGLIIEHMRRAAADGADIVVFSELSVCGYYPGDMLEDQGFLARLDLALDTILLASRATPQLVSVIGTARHRSGPGKPLHNALLAISDGAIVAEYYKQLLPTYGIFDERRHFEPGPEVACTLDVAGYKIGFMVCEDGWNDAGRDYQVNPFDALHAAGPDLIVSINASPSDIGKRVQRHELFNAACRHTQVPLLYVNQIGGQDQLVFDGASFAVSPTQGIAFEARRFCADYGVVGLEQGRFVATDGAALPVPDAIGLSVPEFTHSQIVLGLRDYARRCNFSKVVVGCSGGIDSALTLALAVDALGKDKVFAVTMPSAFSSEGSVSDSVALCRNLDIPLYTHPIRALVEQYRADFAQAFAAPLHGLPLENLQARVRGTILMEYSNNFGALLLTTGNKSELATGYSTLYGDSAGGFGPIKDVFKTLVWDLSRWRNEYAERTGATPPIPVNSIEKAPSAELAPGQLDTDSLPAYDELDALLDDYVEKDMGSAELIADGHDPALVERVIRLVDLAEFKRRQYPPGPKISPKNFGRGRRLPITNAWREPLPRQ